MTTPPQGPVPPYPPPAGPVPPHGPPQSHPETPTQQIPLSPNRYIPRPTEVPVEGEHETRAGRGGLKGLFSDPLSAVLTVVIVVALALAALLGGEFYARHRADQIVASAVGCIVQDGAKASFGARPFLLQHFSHHYRDMRVETAGNQIREAKGMKLQLLLDDIRMDKTADSAGTLGSLEADITWSADGIQKTVAGMLPLIGGLVSGVTPDPSSGTLDVLGPLGSVTIKPGVADGGLALQVIGVSGLGFTLPRETAQPALDAFTDQLTRNLPMGIHADSVEVTDTGVAARFVTQNATIPNSQQDPCFAGL